MTKAHQAGRLSKINRAFCCHQREVASAAPNVPEAFKVCGGVTLLLYRKMVCLRLEQHICGPLGACLLSVGGVEL